VLALVGQMLINVFENDEINEILEATNIFS